MLYSLHKTRLHSEIQTQRLHKLDSGAAILLQNTVNKNINIYNSVAAMSSLSGY